MLYAFLLCASAFASERAPEVGLTIEPIVAMDTSTQNKNADVLESWTWIRARAKQQTEGGQWFLGVDGEHHVRHGIDTEAIWNLHVAESGWSGKIGQTHLRAGALIERWGKLDLTPVIDVLNPRDLRAGPLATIEALRIPVPMITAQAGHGGFRAQAIWTPFPSSDRVTMEGSDWSLVKPGMLHQFVKDASAWDGTSAIVLAEPLEQLADALNDTAPSTTRSLTQALGGIDQPEANGLHGNYGLRLAIEAPGVDAALVGANLQSSIPATRVSPEIHTIIAQEELPDINDMSSLLNQPPLETQWPRTWMTGAEVSTVAGPIGIRSEIGWWSNKVIQKPWFESEQSPALAAGAGIDWAHGSILYLALEGKWHRWLNPPQEMFLTQKDRVEAGGTARLSVANETVQIQTAGLFDFAYKEWMARPEIRWRASDPLSIGLGAIIIQGPEDAPKTLRETLTWTGGPLGLMTDNDSIFFSFRWIQ